MGKVGIAISILAIGVAAAAVPAPARAEGGSGNLLCLEDVAKVRNMLQQRSGRLSTQAVKDYSRRLDIADSQCQAESSPSSEIGGEMAAVRDELQRAPSTAELPNVAPSPPEAVPPQYPSQ